MVSDSKIFYVFLDVSLCKTCDPFEAIVDDGRRATTTTDDEGWRTSNDHNGSSWGKGLGELKNINFIYSSS